MPLRFDRAELPAPERTKEGFLRTTAVVARPGVLAYPKPDGTIDRELVTAEVLAASAKGLADNVITVRHPMAPNGQPLRVTKENADKYTVGHTRDDVIVNADGSVAVPVTITHAKGIEAVDGGMRGISPLYDAVVVDAPPGSVHPEFGPYNKIQTKREYASTIAICPLGRGGPQCHLRADDSEAMVMIEGGDAAAEPAAESAFAIGSRVQIAPGKEHEPEHKGAAGTVREASGEALGIEFDNMPGQVHRWYVASELTAADGATAPEPTAAAEESAETKATKAAIAAMLERFGVATIDEAWQKISAEFSELYAKRDALSGLMALLQCDTAEAVRAKIESMMAPPAPPEVRADSAENRAWFRGRAKLDAAALALGMTPAEIDALGDDELRKTVVLKRQPSLRADEAPAYYAAAFDLAPADHLAPLRHPGKAANTEVRADAAPDKKPSSRWDDAFNKPPRS